MKMPLLVVISLPLLATGSATEVDREESPAYHFVIPCDGQPGDPNGVFQYNGRYHLMYLYKRPGEFAWAWGHASSADLFNWKLHRDAIGPDKTCPGGCYSGGAFVDDDGKAYLSYVMLHSVGLGLAVGEGDFETFVNLPENPIVPRNQPGWTLWEDPQGRKVKSAAFDDPSNIWKKDGRYYMLAGNLSILRGQGLRPDSPEELKGDRAYLFESDDLRHWRYRHPFYRRRGTESRATGWTDPDEDCMCPSFLPLPDAKGRPSGKHLLLFISHNRGCQYYIGTYDTKGDTFLPESHGRMTWQDKSFFAPEALVDDRGRQLFWTWLVDNRKDEFKRFGKTGVYALPRSVWLAENGTLGLAPAEEVKTLRRRERDFGSVNLAKGEVRTLDGFRGTCCELELRLDARSATNFALELKASRTAGDKTVVRLDAERGELVFDASASDREPIYDFCNHVAVERAPFRLKPDEPLTLRVFIDGPVVEVCANERQMITRRVYVSDPTSTAIRLVAAGGELTKARVRAWELGAAAEELFRPNSVVLFQGDSITSGFRAGDMNGPYGQCFVGEIAAHYQAEHPQSRVEFANRAVPGDTSSNVLARWSTDAFPYTVRENGYESAFGRKKGAKVIPDYLSILVGINDYYHALRKDAFAVSCADYEKNLRQMIETARAANPNVKLVLCEPFRIPVDATPDFCRRQDVVAKLAAEYDAAFVPFQKLFGEDLLKKNANPSYWFWDFFHATPAGHVEMAKFWTASVRRHQTRAARNTALEPRGELENNGAFYSWYARHADIVKRQKALDPQIVFIGDSITHGFEINDELRGNAKDVCDKWFGALRPLNMGFGWDRIQNVLWRLGHGEMDGTNPKAVVILIGTNNTTPGCARPFPANTADEIADGIVEVCRRVREKAPRAKIVLMDVFPRAEKDSQARRDVANVNAALGPKVSALADANLVRLSLWDKFVSPDGSIPKDLMFDALHPTAKGYELWASALRSLLDEPSVSVDGTAEVRIAGDDVFVSSTGEVSFVTLTWPNGVACGTRVLNDVWERSYGDLRWQPVTTNTVHSPWYFLAEKDGETRGFGVATGPGAMCCWKVSADGLSLVLDVRAAGRPVRLGGRELKACRLVRATSRPGESAWQFGRRFCRAMCPKPRLPKTPVYGYNDWYCAYGKNTATNFLADAAYIVACAKGCANEPYVVMDDGWQKNSPPVVYESGRGPWDAAGPNFGMDMPTFCRKIAELGAKPGLWYRPFRAWDELPSDERLLKDARFLDPTVPAVKARIAADIARFRGWGVKLVKIDYLCFDLSDFWPRESATKHRDRYMQDDRAWRDSSRTTAEVVLDLYRTMREAAGDDVVIIGCNAFNHLAAGVFELQRTGDDTSGRAWATTRLTGINTLAMRSIQDGAFFKIDADCVGLASAGAVPWRLNGQWMDLLGRSGTPMFVSWHRNLATPEVRAALAESFRRAAQDRPAIEPLDWMETRAPKRWRGADGPVAYDWND